MTLGNGITSHRQLGPAPLARLQSKAERPRVLQKMSQVLDNHPKVKGIQVRNYMGQYMLSR